jgi:putative redox protein
MSETPSLAAGLPGAVGPEAVLVEETGLGRFQVEVRARGATLLVDEPAAVGGLGSGPNPYDLLSAALGSCTSMTMRLYAERKGWPLGRIRVRVAHVRGTLTSRDRFEREITLEGDLDETQRARLLEIANRCPVHLLLDRGSDVATRVVAQDQLEGPDHGVGQHMRHMVEACTE